MRKRNFHVGAEATRIRECVAELGEVGPGLLGGFQGLTWGSWVRTLRRWVHKACHHRMVARDGMLRLVAYCVRSEQAIRRSIGR